MTNQHYLHLISAQLNLIQTQLDHLLDFLYDDKACRIYAEVMAVMSIYRNYSSIMACNEQRIASIQTIQQAKIFAEQNIQFYYRDMNSLVDKNGPIGDKSPVKGFEDIIKQIRKSMTTKTEYIVEKSGAIYQRKA